MALGTGQIVTVEIKGLDSLQEKLEALPEKLAKRSLRKALRAGANVIKKAIIDLAPRRTGFLSQHFGIRTKVMRDEIAGSSFIGPQGKIDYPLRDGRYIDKVNRKGKTHKTGRISVASVARFLEFGTSKMGKRPFMTAAFDTHKEQALDAIVEEFKDGLKNVS